MKQFFFTLSVVLSVSNITVYSQVLLQENLGDKEKMEIKYITDCIISKRNIDNLVEWKFSSKYENNIIYKYKRGRLVFFLIEEKSTDLFLKSIVYQRHSFEKTIFLDEAQTKYKIDSETQFRVLMSKEIPSIYFCIMTQNNVIIWVLSNGNTVYSPTHPRL